MLSTEHECQRLKELQSFDILDTPPDGEFDDLTHIASKVFNVPISIVSLVDSDRVWFKSAFGLSGVRQIERGPGLCASAILSDDVYVANDLRQDPNSLANPLVANENGFRFYAAEPLKTKTGFKLGTFCLLDRMPREFSTSDQTLLKRFGHIVMLQMEQRLASRRIAGLAESVVESNKILARDASYDGLTGVFNRRSIDRCLSVSQPTDKDATKTFLLLDVDFFKSINDRYGHPAGDAVLVEIAKRISRSVRPQDHVGRYGGEEFIVVLDKCTPDVGAQIAERIRQSVGSQPIAVGDCPPIRVTISGGLCHGDGNTPPSRVLKLADEALYSAKQAGRNRIVAISA